MTTLGDRVKNLEDAFAQVVPLLKEILDTQKSILEKLNEHSGRLSIIENYVSESPKSA